MAKLSDKSETKVKHVMVFGPPKAGKTELVGKLAEKFNLYWCDIEKGIDVLKKMPKEWQERIDFVQIPDTRTTPMAIETCLKIIKGLPVKICDVHGKVGCPLCAKEPTATYVEWNLSKLGPNDVFVLDSATQLKNSAIANMTRNKDDDYQMTFHDWGNLGKIMDTFFSHVQAAPYNVVVITHEEIVDMTNGGSKIVPVGGTANFSRNVAKYFDEVVYCEVKNKKHVFASGTTYSNTIMTGGRSGVKLEDKVGDVKLLDLWN